jgi:branched-chain amino acid transport system permease protein
MTPELLLIQTLNGLQFGVLLFLMAAGLTLVFGIMSFVNLAHGALYMFGAYFAAAAWNATGSFALAVLAGFGGVFVLGCWSTAPGCSRCTGATTWTTCWPPSAWCCSPTSWRA